MAVSPSRTIRITLSVVSMMVVVVDALRTWLITDGDLNTVGLSVCGTVALCCLWYWLYIRGVSGWVFAWMVLTLIQIFTLKWWFPRVNLMAVVVIALTSSLLVCAIWYIISAKHVVGHNGTTPGVKTDKKLSVASAAAATAAATSEVKLTAEEQATVQRKMAQHLDLQVAREALNRLQRRLEFHQFSHENYVDATHHDLDKVTAALDWQTSVPPEERSAETQTVKMLKQYFLSGKGGSSNDMPPHLVSWVRCHLMTPVERQQRGVRVRPLQECYDELHVKYPSDPAAPIVSASSEAKHDTTDV